MKLPLFRMVTEDLPALAAFYQTVTGCSPVGTEDYVEIRTPGSILALCTRRAIGAPNEDVVAAENNRSTILEFEVEDVDAERTRLAGIVADWVQEPIDRPWGDRSMLFRDPDGNLVNFFTPLPAQPRGPQGMTWLWQRYSPTVTWPTLLDVRVCHERRG